MSYNIDGKIANQSPMRIMSGEVKCSKCCKILPFPTNSILNKELSNGMKFVFLIWDYFDLPYFIHETKSGTAAVYCSDYCRRKHNHRYNKNG